MAVNRSPSIVARWQSWAPYLRSVLRIVAAFLFMQYGTMKLFAFPIGMPPNGAAAPLISEMGLAGVLEVFGGGLLLLGLFTRPVGFLLSGEMAVAYFRGHFPQGYWPIQLHDGGGHQPRERIVKSGNARPVCFVGCSCPGVAGGDCRLQRVRAWRATELLGSRQLRKPAANQQLIPAPAILIEQAHRLP